MKRITLPYTPGSGQIPNPTPVPPSSGAMEAGDSVEFFWHTPPVLNKESVKGNFFLVPPSDNNATFTCTFMGDTKTVSGPGSAHWTFSGNFALNPDTDYLVVCKADLKCAGLTGKLNPGPKDKTGR